MGINITDNLNYKFYAQNTISAHSIEIPLCVCVFPKGTILTECVCICT